MKKILAIVLSAMMILSVGFGTTVVASAADVTVNSQETTKKRVNPSVTVNGSQSSNVEYDIDKNDPNQIIFTYTGDSDLTGWNFYDGDGNLLQEGVDYTVVFKGNQAIVTIINDDINNLRADAIVEDEEEEPTNPTKPTKPNKGPQSPDTGAMGLTGLAVAGAGAAILAAMKRKSDAE